MDETTISVGESVRDELRSFKADHGLTYEQAIVRLLDDTDWEFRHVQPEDYNDNGD